MNQIVPDRSLPTGPALVEARLASLEQTVLRLRATLLGFGAVILVGVASAFGGRLVSPSAQEEQSEVPVDSAQEETPAPQEPEGAEPPEDVMKSGEQAAPSRPPGPEQIVLRDAAGRERVWLGVLEDGGCGFGLYDASGVARSEFFVDVDGASRLLISDRKGAARALFGVGDDGTPQLQLAGPTGQPLLEAGLFPDGSTRLRLRQAGSARRFEIRLLSDGRPGLEIYGEDGKVRAALGLSVFDEPGLRLRDSSGRSLFER